MSKYYEENVSISQEYQIYSDNNIYSGFLLEYMTYYYTIFWNAPNTLSIYTTLDTIYLHAEVKIL